MRATLFNALSILFFILTLAVATGVVALLASPPPPTPVADLPTLAPPLPTLTPSNTPTPTIPPTFTPSPTNTLTLTPSLTPSLTPTPSATLTATPTITDTPGPTNTPENTPTPQPTPTPTGPTAIPTETEIPFAFRLREEPRFLQNFANTLGCSWQGIGGQVFRLDGSEFFGAFRVRVFNSTGTFEQLVNIGTNSFYGPVTGWEVQVAPAPNTETYFVQLETQFSVASPRVQVTFPGNCLQNVALVNFIQSREF